MSARPQDAHEEEEDPHEPLPVRTGRSGGGAGDSLKEGVGGGEGERESKRLKRSPEDVGAADDREAAESAAAEGEEAAVAAEGKEKEAEAEEAEVHPDDEEDAAKAGGDAVPTSPSNAGGPSPRGLGASSKSDRSFDRRHEHEHEEHHGIEAPPPPKPPAPADWRETLFVWRGLVTYNPTKRRCDWIGSWAPQVSAVDGPPTDRDFETHQENQFVLHRVLDKRIDLGRATTIPEVLYGRSLSWLGFYKLDQDDGKGRQRLVDFSHLFMVQPVFDKPQHPPPPLPPPQEEKELSRDGDNGRLLGVVGAVGSNEFGNFVSAGRICEVLEEETPEGGGERRPATNKLTMTLARRYIGSRDGRTRWKTPKEAMKELDLEKLKAGDFWAVVPTKEAQA